MHSIFIESDKNNIVRRIGEIHETNVRKWGKMNIVQMLHHTAEALRIPLGEKQTVPARLPMPMFMVRFMILRMAWPKNSPTVNEINQIKNPSPLKDFNSEKSDLIALVEKFNSLPADFKFSDHPILGNMKREQWGRFVYQHLNWHLGQFSA